MVATTLGTTNITWDAVEGATGYTVCVRRSKDGEWEELADTEKTTWSTDQFGRNRDYAFTVKAYTEKKGKRTYSEKNEISEFPYLTQKNGVTYVDGLLIVNKTYSLPRSYGPGGLTPETNAAFEEMKKGAAKDGYSIWVCSGYRSYDYQNTLYWNYVARDGSQASADRYSARAGYSEHQSGLAADINQASRYFNGSPVALWLAANAWKYGFIIRYPEGKEDITGYNYESWHVRYVGKEMSKLLTESGLTLEEYYGLTSKYSD
ncbi:MAG: M15 family metallopeptidase [Ruminococcus sp.]|nr:M15 family metallopeptidase [Ruminococcus sp.]